MPRNDARRPSEAVQPEKMQYVGPPWRHERPAAGAVSIALFCTVARVHLLSKPLINRMLKEFGLTREMFDVLATLWRAGPPYRLTPTQLSRLLMLTGPGTTNRLDRLEEDGLVVRTPDHRDRRSLHISLTSDGFELIEKIAPRLALSEGELLAGFAPEKTARLKELLDELAEHLTRRAEPYVSEPPLHPEATVQPGLSFFAALIRGCLSGIIEDSSTSSNVSSATHRLASWLVRFVSAGPPRRTSQQSRSPLSPARRR
jgi:DNA-binding MarR family transcriptional regulator